MDNKTKKRLKRSVVAAFKGVKKGGIAGGVLAVGTGLAVVATAPAWVLFVGGAAVISTGTVATCAAIGAGVGGAITGTKEYLKSKKTDDEFAKIFENRKKGEKNEKT